MARVKTSVTLDEALLREARELGVNVSAAAADGVAGVVKSERWRRWQEENRPWIEAYNEWIEENGLPLARYRKF
ncbi:type II toxin-antitoxin system CcdA family antitoxin [Jannaschia sp. W003]|uniref:type II toxin-antitoxin system CcdA family antitoxin n=1 Tax=Jannaschia sp. W003 TaxID=2867012 RepID=UPI0021A582C6|nr:type II toxin-antitoxin system CcdA family antitoxin [Jannaschia sp. W003]UWQ22011.1 type II toxin-antitoxin system CcdA family antitoxin [Jannaschia sp. W003]